MTTATNIRRFVAKLEKLRASTSDSMETIVSHLKGNAASTGVSVYGNLVDEANRLDAYDYVLRGFGVGDHRSRSDMPDGYTVHDAPFEVLMAVAEDILYSLRNDMVQQARRPVVRTSHSMNPEYFYTLGDLLHKLETAISDDKFDARH